MAAKKPPARMRLEPAPTAQSAMARAVSVAMTILEITKQPSWPALCAEVRAEAPKVRVSLLTLDIDPATAALLTEHASVLDLIRYGPGAAGRKPTTTTMLVCGSCDRWLVGSQTSGTPTCVLTVGCTGKLIPVKKASKIANPEPAADPATDPDATQPDPAQPNPADPAAAAPAEAELDADPTDEPATPDETGAPDDAPEAIAATAEPIPAPAAPSIPAVLRAADPTMFD